MQYFVPLYIHLLTVPYGDPLAEAKTIIAWHAAKPGKTQEKKRVYIHTHAFYNSAKLSLF